MIMNTCAVYWIKTLFTVKCCSKGNSNISCGWLITRKSYSYKNNTCSVTSTAIHDVHVHVVLHQLLTYRKFLKNCWQQINRSKVHVETISYSMYMYIIIHVHVHLLHDTHLDSYCSSIQNNCTDSTLLGPVNEYWFSERGEV